MYKLRIGLEIHLQLLTKAKAFSNAKNSNMLISKNSFHVNELDLGYPGTLPIISKEYIIKGLIAAHILNMKIAKKLSFDRKHYIYSDLPKGFQITQYFEPLGTNGYLWLPESGVKIAISEIHLEEDTAKQLWRVFDLDNMENISSFYEASEKDQIKKMLAEKSEEVKKKLENSNLWAVYMDYNRCGKSLLEIVTKPDFTSWIQVVEFIELIKMEMINANLAYGSLQTGSLRCDVNLSIFDDEKKISTNRVEIKNLNSLRSIRDAIMFEADLHKEALQQDVKIEMETKRFNEDTGKTETMRKKDQTEEYFYMPEPNIIPISIPSEWIEEAKEETPLSVIKLKKNMVTKYFISKENATIICNNDFYLQIYKKLINSTFFKDKYRNNKPEAIKIITTIINWLLQFKMKFIELMLDNSETNDITNLFNVTNIFHIYEVIKSNKISSKDLKNVIINWINGVSMGKILYKYIVKTVMSTAELEKLIEDTVKENMEFIQLNLAKRRQRVEKMLMGQIMKQIKGAFKPQEVMEIITKHLKNC